MTAVALRMTGADFLKLRKKRGTLIWVLVLALLPVIVLFTVKAIQHSSNAVQYGPAGGTSGFIDGLRLLCLFFGPLAAILIGVEAGTGDASAGVFRDLVVTGRSRLALFASRVPAALAVCWLVAVARIPARAAWHVCVRLRSPHARHGSCPQRARLRAAGHRRRVRGRRRLRVAHDLEARRDHRADRLAARGQSADRQHKLARTAGAT